MTKWYLKKNKKLKKINENRKPHITINKDDTLYHKQQTRDKLTMKYQQVKPIAQTENKIKTETSKYSKHNIKRRKKY